jgi:hypothetical protein
MKICRLLNTTVYGFGHTPMPCAHSSFYAHYKAKRKNPRKKCQVGEKSTTFLQLTVKLNNATEGGTVKSKCFVF